MFDDLNTLVNNLAVLPSSDTINSIYVLYESAARVLQHSQNLVIPKRKKTFYTFWWSQMLDSPKVNAILSCRAWKDAGKPRKGHIFNKYKQNKHLHKESNKGS